ncbi:MAG: hypothetical protein HOP15_09135 [Planctomycetes bacterium]|nr:hypothetical protein [Planctomycetota bacterium]
MSETRRCPRFLGLPGLALAGVVLAGLAACNGPASDREQRVVEAVQQGRFGEALEHARRFAQANPDDPKSQALYRDAQIACLLDQGRDEVFHGDLTRGLGLFEQARAIAPEHPTVASWIQKTRAQLAVEWLDAAAARSGPEHLDEAEGCFEKVLEYDPANEGARQGLAHVLLLKNYRAGMSKTYFDDGLSSFQELMLERARRDFQISNRYRENEPASLRGQQVEEMIAEDRLDQASRLESAARYFAARNEYRLVLLIDPDNAAGRAGLDRMDREARATSTLAEADMAMRRGEFARAEESLAVAELLTEAQRDGVSLMQSGIEVQRLAEKYDAAQSLWRDFRYPEAVVAFDELLALAPEYEDAARRRATLLEFIRMAEEFYPKALEATDERVAEEYLRQIQLVWPEYKDVVERLKAIEARKAEEPEEAGGGR